MSETMLPPNHVDPSPRRLTRHPTDKVVAGVAGGLGRYFGVDPIVFRLAFVAFALFGGGGVLLYLLAWLAIPAGDDRPAPSTRGGVDLAAWIGLALVVIALLTLGGAMFTLRPGFVVALVLLAGGFLLFQHSGQQQASGGQGAPSDAGTEPPDATLSPAATGVGDGGASGDATSATAGSTGPREAPAPRSRLGRFTLALLFLALGTLGFLHGSSFVTPDAGHYAALALACVGAGLVVGAWWGRARWLIAVGVVLVPVALVTSLFPRDLDYGSGAGEVFRRPLTSEQLASSYRLGAGRLTVDLSQVELGPGERRDVSASIGMGELLVIVPATVSVEIRAEAGVGEVEGFGLSRDGVRPELRMRQAGLPLAGELRLDLRAGFGRVRVVRDGVDFPASPFGDLRLRLPGAEVF